MNDDASKAPKICPGINLNFAKFVYGHKRTLEIVRDEIGAHYAEMATDMDYGPAFFLTDPDRFRAYHTDVAEFAERIGIGIPTMLAFYRDNVSVTHSNPEIREHAFTVMRMMAAQGGCLGCRVVGAPFGTVLTEDMGQKRDECMRAGLEYWQRWLELLHGEGVEIATLETMSTLREPPCTIADAKALLESLSQYHLAHGSSTCRPAYCYDTGHGPAEEESRCEEDAQFEAWFRAMPTDIVQIHVKNTDPQFLATWPFTEEYSQEGIIDLRKLVRAVRENLRVRTLYMMIEVPGKRGRLIGERESLRVNRLSYEQVLKALYYEGFREDPHDHTWSIPPQS